MIEPVLGSTVRAQYSRVLSHVEKDVGMIVWGRLTHAIESGNADLNATHARFVEE